ncbi:MAG TPA: gluconate 2-dehydrogenase subunit 3 family protein [Chryseosolibacter sp.]|nr:gluconate 2-dehydrogenase subunit 3 family protein [Chryseosolibacter sp.]
MDRRKYLKSLIVGTAGTGLLLESCKTEVKEAPEQLYQPTIDRTVEEKAYERKLLNEKFFDEHEMKTIAILADIIIPRDDFSGSATDAGVPDFIEFIVKDMPKHQLPMRGGLRWLDLHSLKRFNTNFVSCSDEERIRIVDDIAYPEHAAAELSQGVSFFNLMRDLTATGFFTSKMGIADLGYVGNRPNQWDGVPKDVLDKYGVSYDQRTLDISVKFT